MFDVYNPLIMVIFIAVMIVISRYLLILAIVNYYEYEKRRIDANLVEDLNVQPNTLNKISISIGNIEG